MKKLLILSIFCFQVVYASQSLDHYFSYLSQLNQREGNCTKGEIEIVTDLLEISRIQKIQENRLLAKGFSADQAAEFSRIGVVNEDQYLIWLRDAVYFPKGIPGTYDRLLWRNELKNKYPGVVILPVLSSGKILVILTYRHATRSWEFELPRGGIEPQETAEIAARRELKEETGCLVSSIISLGEIAVDTGLISSVIPVFIGKISDQQESVLEYSEAINGTFAFTKDELKEGLVKGSLEVTIENVTKQIPIRDAFLTFALLQAEARQLL